MANEFKAKNGVITPVLQSTVATGTAPLSVTSTTRVANLNVATAGTADTATNVTGTVAVTNGGTGTATAFTLGSVVFAGASGTYTQDNAQFFWDDSNNRLGIGTASPTATLDITKATNGNAFIVNAPGGANPNFTVQGSGEQTFRIYNSAPTGSTRTSIKLASRLNSDWEWIAYTDFSGTGVNDLTIANTSGIALSISNNRNVNIATSLTVSGDLVVNGLTTTVNSSTLTVDDKNIELGSVASATVSTTGNVTAINGTGPWTAIVNGMSSTNGLIVGSAISATAGTGTLFGGSPTSVVVTSINSGTSISYTVTGGTTPTAGTVTTITTTGASNFTADGGGITLKGTTDKTFNWVNATAAWTSSEDLNLLTGKVYEINGTTVLSATTLGSGVTSSSLTTVGTIGTGVWAATDVGVLHGGTGASDAATARVNLGTPERATAFPTNNQSSIRAGDLRTITNPTTGLGYANGVRFRFSSLNDDNSTPYADVIDLTTYADASGGGFNSLYFGKNSQVLLHKYAAADATAWTTKTIAYLDSNITGNAGTVTNGVYTVGNQSIAGIKTFTNNTASTNTTTGSVVVTGGVGVSGNLNVGGSLFATSKSFRIVHPTKAGMSLTYGSLEGPENGVYVRGKLTNNNTIELPEYWTKLVDADSITVSLTPIGSHQNLYVESIENNKVIVANSNLINKTINCFFIVYAERCDVDKLQVEI